MARKIENPAKATKSRAVKDLKLQELDGVYKVQILRNVIHFRKVRMLPS